MFNIYKCKDGHFFIGTAVNDTDNIIAYYLRMSVQEYRNIMVYKFHAYLYDFDTTYSHLYFRNKKFAENALDWIKEKYLIYYLAELDE